MPRKIGQIVWVKCWGLFYNRISYYFSPLSLALVTMADITVNPKLKTCLVLGSLFLLALFFLKLMYGRLLKIRLPFIIFIILPTCTMSAMSLSKYLIPVNLSLAHGIWIIFFIFHLSIMAYFFSKHHSYQKIKEIFHPGLLVMFRGVLSTSISGSYYHMQLINLIIIIIGTTNLLLFYPLLIKYVIVIKNHVNVPVKMMNCQVLFCLETT